VSRIMFGNYTYVVPLRTTAQALKI